MSGSTRLGLYLSYHLSTSMMSILGSHVCACPLTQPKKVESKEIEFNADFIRRMLKRVQWGAVKEAADIVRLISQSHQVVVRLYPLSQVGAGAEIPPEAPQNYEENEDFLKKAHHVLLEVEVVEGELECPETGRKFPINNGIPNLLLREDEV